VYHSTDEVRSLTNQGDPKTVVSVTSVAICGVVDNSGMTVMLLSSILGKKSLR
jgi:hypothetical protein